MTLRSLTAFRKVAPLVTDHTRGMAALGRAARRSAVRRPATGLAEVVYLDDFRSRRRPSGPTFPSVA